MGDLSIVRAVNADQAMVYATLVSAFAEDPVERWLYPKRQAYLDRFPGFLAAFGGIAFDDGVVWTLAGHAAVAMWLPPGAEPDGDAITAYLGETVDPAQHDDMFAVLEQMAAAHPAAPHWYLPWLGVTAAAQGGGLGGALLSQCLEVVERDGLPVYLETPNPRTVAFYARRGFAVTGTAQAGTCPPITFMTRPAR